MSTKVGVSWSAALRFIHLDVGRNGTCDLFLNLLESDFGHMGAATNQLPMDSAALELGGGA